MADEEKKSSADSPEETRPPTEYVPGEAELLPESETVIDEAAKKLVEKSEEATDTPAVEAFDTAVTAVTEAIESVGGAPTSPAESQAHLEHSDTVEILGRQITVMGGIYTVVFGALAVLTVLEVLIGSLQGDWKVIPLMAIAIGKAALVVLFYMHLRTDSRIFALTLAVPLGIALLSILYVLAVPVTSY
jgi:caa(3)-type oxidase subunit IV